MINNRTSSSGRRRGRGGSRNPNSNRPGEGNRIDSRARGNAAQLHEKYKGLARDAHNQGDRVMQEYYLQFADHYFRILSENAQRQDEYRRQRDGGRDDYDADQDEGEYAVEGEPADAGAQPREARGEREEQAERPQAPQPERARRSRRSSSSRYRDEERAGEDEDRIAVDRLPAAISVSNNLDDAEAETEQANGAPRRRSTRSRTVSKPDDDDGGLIAEA